MEMIFLAKLIGVYLIIVGFIAMVRRSTMMPTMAELFKTKALIIVVAFLELAAGIAIVLTGHVVTFTPEGVIALVGWIMIIESILYLSLPFPRIQKILRPFNKKEWYLFGGALALVTGVWLAGSGFGMF